MLQASCEKQERALRETIEALKASNKALEVSNAKLEVSNEKKESYLKEIIEGKDIIIIAQKEKFDQKLQVIEEELLRLRGNFNLRGALGKILILYIYYYHYHLSYFLPVSHSRILTR